MDLARADKKKKHTHTPRTFSRPPLFVSPFFNRRIPPSILLLSPLKSISIRPGDDDALHLYRTNTGALLKTLYSKKYGCSCVTFTHASQAVVYASKVGCDTHHTHQNTDPPPSSCMKPLKKRSSRLVPCSA